MSLPPILETTEQVADFVATLENSRSIAVDLEADSMHNYQEKVCLLQVTIPEKTVLIDPLAGAGLDPLKAVLGDDRIRKIFHAADYDIRCLARDFSIEIRGLFDTMIACQFLGEERFGLADILKKYFSVELDKQYQRADWSRRPLSAEMIRYAAEDTRHLHQLAEQLQQRLREKGRLTWVEEEFSLLEQVRFADQQGNELLRFKGAGRLNRRQLAVLEAVLNWRDNEARRRDSPLFKVLGNKVVLALALAAPQSRQQLDKVEGFPSRLRQRYGDRILGHIAAAMQIPETELPVYPHAERKEKDPAGEQRLKRLKQWRQAKAKQLELDPGVLINNATLELLAERRPRTTEDLAADDELKKWQLRELGPGILETLN